MTASPIIVRPPRSTAELTKHVEGAFQAFSRDPLPEDIANWQRSLTSSPDYRSEMVRGAYRDDEQLGGYLLYERMLRVGKARLTTGCIGSVYARPEYRKQNVATALMHDAIEYAHAHNYPLLLLDGIAKFYYRYGYCDVYDLSTQDIDRQAILALPPSSYIVRPVMQDDAASILALYERHFGSYTGSFVRSLETQRHWLQPRRPDQPPTLFLASDADGQARGYLLLVGGQNRSQARELAVDDWSAAVALLQYHARLVEGPDAPVALMYDLPLTSLVLQWMVDSLEVIDTSAWENPTFGWAVRDQTYHHTRAGWMARLVSLPALTQAMLPEWQERWHRSLAHWSGDLSLLVGDEAFTLRITGTNLQLLDSPIISSDTLKLTPQAFTQAVFEYRPIARVMQQSQETLPDDLLTVLNILFPTGNAWIPPSDWF